jgi:osmotically-inducible protein OsmY
MAAVPRVYHAGEELVFSTNVEDAMLTVEQIPSESDVAPAKTRQERIAELAEAQLRHKPYLALRNIRCEYQEGILTLDGCLPSYHLKQVAQAAAASVPGVERINNRIEVVSVWH